MSQEQSPATAGEVAALSEQEKIVAELMRWLAAVDGEPDWAVRRLFVKPMTAGVEFVLQEKSPRGTGQAGGLLGPEQADAVLRLQRVMATPRGAWFDAMLTLTNGGTGDARFNSANEPTPLATEAGYPPAELAAHLRAFPRAEGDLEPWMRD